MSDECGPLVLTISFLNGTDPLIGFGDCVRHFHDIVAQCAATDDRFSDRIAGGVLEVDQVVYNVSVSEYDHHNLETRGQSASKGTKKPTKIKGTRNHSKTRTRKKSKKQKK